MLIAFEVLAGQFAFLEQLGDDPQAVPRQVLQDPGRRAVMENCSCSMKSSAGSIGFSRSGRSGAGIDLDEVVGGIGDVEPAVPACMREGHPDTALVRGALEEQSRTQLRHPSPRGKDGARLNQVIDESRCLRGRSSPGA